MAIAVWWKPELPVPPLTAELGAGGRLHYGDRRAPEAETEGCGRRGSPPPFFAAPLAARALAAGLVGLHASVCRWPGPALVGGVRLADAACRCLNCAAAQSGWLHLGASAWWRPVGLRAPGPGCALWRPACPSSRGWLTGAAHCILP